MCATTFILAFILSELMERLRNFLVRRFVGVSEEAPVGDFMPVATSIDNDADNETYRCGTEPAEALKPASDLRRKPVACPASEI